MEAINKGLRMATGEILCWLNSDDFYLPGTLHTVAENLAPARGHAALVGRLRVEFACEELSRPDTPLIRIALAAGFYDQGHFCRTFKRLTGITPTAYRRNISRSLIPSEKL